MARYGMVFDVRHGKAAAIVLSEFEDVRVAFVPLAALSELLRVPSFSENKSSKFEDLCVLT